MEKIFQKNKRKLAVKMSTLMLDGNNPPMLLDPIFKNAGNQTIVAIILSLIVVFCVFFLAFEIFLLKYLLGKEKWEEVKIR